MSQIQLYKSGTLQKNLTTIREGYMHFLRYFIYGRRNKMFGLFGSLRRQMNLIRDEFDVDFYLDLYPDVAASEMDPLVHYLKYGAAEGRDPCSQFSTKFYLKTNPDVLASGINPFVHFVQNRRRERRSFKSDAPKPHEDINSQIKLIRNDFDEALYLANYPDVAEAGHNPVEHYLRWGAAEGRNPSEHFSTRYYLESNPDVAADGINPFVHYVLAGRSEGRLSLPIGDFRARILKAMVPLEQRTENWRFNAVHSVPLTVKEIKSALKSILLGDSATAVICFSHDDYTSVIGGVQLCIQTEQQRFLEAGIVYLNLHPTHPLPILAPNKDWRELLLNLMCNGKLIGVVSVDRLISALSHFSIAKTEFLLLVHALHGHAPEAVQRIAEAAQITQSYYWVHDYFSICPSYNLLRNDIRYCNAPPVDSAACSICVYGHERRGHAMRLKELFESLKFNVVAPSESAIEIWKTHSNLPAEKTLVLPHCSLDESPQVFPDSNRSADQKVRIAYIGFPVVHKGWPIFKQLINKHVNSKRYQFYCFGEVEVQQPNMTAIPVSVTYNNSQAMIDALWNEKIDIVLVLSIWPETYCFTAHEAVAAGAKIVTLQDSGNVARLVRENDWGIVVEDEANLFSLFAKKEVINLTRSFRQADRKRMNLVLSGMTKKLIDEEGTLA